MLSNFRYYTGIIFKTYTYGTGDTIVTGGRYDHLLEQFGRDATAVGFGIYLDRLLAAMSRQKVMPAVPSDSVMIVYEEDLRRRAIERASELRSEGKAVQLTLRNPIYNDDDYRADAVSCGISDIVFYK